MTAAAFGRLCVETLATLLVIAYNSLAAAFGRLCVETAKIAFADRLASAAAFGRLCVETKIQRPVRYA